MPAVIRGSIALALAGMLAGCRGEASEARPAPQARPEARAPAVRDLEVMMSGCWESVASPPTCELHIPTELHLWVAGPHAPKIFVDEAEVAPHEGYPRSIDDGHLVIVDVTPGQNRLEVHTGPEASPGRWSLDLRSEQTPTIARLRKELPELGQAPTEKVYVRAEAELRAAEPSMSVPERVASLALRQKLYRRFAHTEKSLEAGREGMLLALEAGRFQFAARIGRVLEFTLRKAGRDAESRWPREVQALYSPLSGDADAMSRAWFHKAQAAAARGALTEAIADFEKAETIARRLGLVKAEAYALTDRLGKVAALHRQEQVVDGVARLLEVIDDPAMGECVSRVRLLGSLAWSLLVVQDAPTEQAMALVDRGLALLEGPSCVRADVVSERTVYASVALNGALAALAEGDEKRAESYLERMGEHEGRDIDTRWEALARGRLDVMRGAPQRALERLEAESGEGDPLLAWEAALVRAEAHDELGQTKRARDQFRAAEAVLDRVVASAGTLRAVDGFVSNVQASAQGLIRHELALGATQAAFDAARRARARPTIAFRRLRAPGNADPEARRARAEAMEAYARDSSVLAEEIRSMETATTQARAASRRRQRELLEGMERHLDAAAAAAGSEEAPVEDLRRPEPDALWVLAHPMGEAWVVFASLDGTVDAHVVELGDDPMAPLSELFGGALDEPLDRADHVVLLPMGALTELPLHTVEWRGKPLVDAKPVAYGLDLPEAPEAGAASQAAAVLISASSTAGALVEAKREGEAVAGHLTRHGWSTDVVAAPALDRAAVRAAFDADLLHYAGHGEAAGRDGLESALLLPDGDRVTVRDILASPRSPRGVVLSACESAMPRAESLDGGTSLATAFLLSGSQWVIATSAPVRDADAHRLSAELYREAVPSSGPHALRRALLASRPDLEDWRLFRVLVP